VTEFDYYRYSEEESQYESTEKQRTTVYWPDNSRVETIFYRDGKTAGYPKFVRVFDAFSGGNQLHETHYEEYLVHHTVGTTATFVAPKKVINSQQGVETRTQYSYDFENGGQYGNLVEIYEDGDTQINGDERRTVMTFAENATDWIVNRPSSINIYDPQGTSDPGDDTLISRTRFAYDENGEGIPPTQGVSGQIK